VGRKKSAPTPASAYGRTLLLEGALITASPGELMNVWLDVRLAEEWSKYFCVLRV